MEDYIINTTSHEDIDISELDKVIRFACKHMKVNNPMLNIVIVDKDRKDIKYTTEVKLNNVKAPIEKGSKVGELILKYDNNTYTYDLVIHDEIKKTTFLKIFFSNLKDIVTGHVKQ